MNRGFRSALSPVLLLTLWVAAAPAGAQVVLNEILADPATDWDGDGAVDAKLDEWIEVYNPGDTSVYLTEYWVRDGLGDTPHLNLFGRLDPGQTAVFYGHHALAWQQENDAGTSGLSLNNSGDTVQLLRADPADPVNLLLVDEKVYGAHEGADDRTAGRLPDGGEWSLFDGLNPYAGDEQPGGNGCEPTPGAINACADETPVDAATWTGVRRRWR
jgi:hypothetical protein